MSAFHPLRAEGVSVALEGREVLHRLDLSAEAGELLALTGPNGSGKSTFLRAALGLQPLSSGRIELFDRPSGTLSVRERARRVAWMPQDEVVLENLPVRQYVRYGRHAHVGPWGSEEARDEAEVMRALAAVDLAPLAPRGILELSGGERQRALLARVLAQEAPLLLLDEPTAHLDMGHQLDLLERVRELCHTEGKTALVALHDLNLAARFADRVAVLHRGHLVADGAAAAVLSPALLLEVWGVVAELRHDLGTGLPYLVPSLPANVAAGGSLRRRVHVVAGGGSAVTLFRALAEAGFLLSAGVLPLFDSDTETAHELGIPVAEEVPFAPVGPRAREENRRLLESADAVVVAPFAVGPANLANLEDLRPEVERAPVVLYEPTPWTDRDFTQGRATALREELVRRGATVVRDWPALRRVLERSRTPEAAPAPELPALPRHAGEA